MPVANDSASSYSLRIRRVWMVSRLWLTSRAWVSVSHQTTFHTHTPSVRGLDLNSSNRGCARLGSEVAPPLGVVIEEVAVLIV